MAYTYGTTEEHSRRMLKRPSSKAAASEEASRTLFGTGASERSETAAGGLFQHPLLIARQAC